MNTRSMPIALGLVLLALISVIAAGPFGLAGGSAGRTSGPTASSDQADLPSATAGETAGGETAPPLATGPPPDATPAPTAAIVDVAISPVSNFRTTANAVTRKDVMAALDGTSARYTGIELVKSEAPAILAALGIEDLADSARFTYARDAARLASDLSDDRKLLGFLRADEIGPDVRALDWGGKALFGVDRVKKVSAWPLMVRLPAPPDGTAYDPNTTWTIFAGGDIMLDRGVYETLEVKGKGADFPFDGGTAEITNHAASISSFGWPVPSTRRTGHAGAVRALISGADIAMANFENPAPNNPSWHTSGTVFSADPKLIDGLAGAGFDYLSLANNHIRDAGASGILQTIRNVKRRGIAVSGAGRNLGAARMPAILEAGGVKVAVLGYDAIAGYYHATDNTVGSAPLTARNVKKDVAAAREAGADLVIVYPHWGTEYDRTPFANQQRLAEMIIDNGADMVIGNHAHWAAAMEVYKGKPIWYALGNLVFDQTWSEPTMEGITLELTFRGTELVQIHMRPHIILDKAQPNFLDPAGDGRVVMGQVYMASKGMLPW